MDTLYINDIRAYGYTGAFAEENVLGQWFRVDLAVDLNLSEAGTSDQLSDTYNYADAVQAIQQLIQQQPFHLIESVVSEIARTVLQSDDRLIQVTVKLTKLTPPVPNFAGNEAVELTRDRSHLNGTSPRPLTVSNMAAAPD